MEAKTLKLLFESGGLARARAAQVSINNAWTLSVVTSNGEEKTVTRVRTKKAKVYKSIDAVLADVRKIGFDSTEIALMK